jgi:hypothetical protein
MLTSGRKQMYAAGPLLGWQRKRERGQQRRNNFDNGKILTPWARGAESPCRLVIKPPSTAAEVWWQSQRRPDGEWWVQGSRQTTGGGRGRGTGGGYEMVGLSTVALAVCSVRLSVPYAAFNGKLTDGDWDMKISTAARWVGRQAGRRCSDFSHR